MALPNSVQQAADYADEVERNLHADAKVTEPKNVEATASEGQVDAEKLRNRYASLQGKYNAEVPRLHAQNRELEERLNQLAEENSYLRTEIAEREEATPYLTEEDSELYGQDMVDLVRRGAREEAAKYAREAAELKGQIQQLQSAFSQTAQESAAMREEAFYSALTQEVPDWEVQNQDAGFLAWLAESDPALGIQRNEALQRAFNAMDAHQVAVIFKQYRTGNQRNSTLERQITPTHTRRASEPHPAGRIWTEQDIAAFYEAWRRNELTDEDARVIEKDINNAVATGRIR